MSRMTCGNGPNERSASSARDEGVAGGISSSLKRLLDDPRRLGAVSLWQALGADEREAATRAYLRAEHAGCRILSQVVAEARNFRPATVGKWPEDKIAAAMRFAPIREPAIASRLLQCHHVPGQVPMVTAFLDALGVPNNDGEIGSFQEVDAGDDIVRPAVTGLVQGFGPKSVAVYLSGAVPLSGARGREGPEVFPHSTGRVLRRRRPRARRISFRQGRGGRSPARRDPGRAGRSDATAVLYDPGPPSDPRRGRFRPGNQGGAHRGRTR